MSDPSACAVFDSAHAPRSGLVLRPYQLAVIQAAEMHIAEGRQRVLIVAPTGSGKTVIAAEIIRRMVSRG